MLLLFAGLGECNTETGLCDALYGRKAGEHLHTDFFLMPFFFSFSLSFDVAVEKESTRQGGQKVERRMRYLASLQFLEDEARTALDTKYGGALSD